MNGANANRKQLKSIAFFLINGIDKILFYCVKISSRILGSVDVCLFFFFYYINSCNNLGYLHNAGY